MYMQTHILKQKKKMGADKVSSCPVNQLACIHIVKYLVTCVGCMLKVVVSCAVVMSEA